MQSFKIVCVGDGATGKTSLLQTFALDKFPDMYEPTVFDNYECSLLHEQKIYSLSLWDCAGQEDYKDMRVLSYPYTDIFILCYSCISPASYKNLDRWIEELYGYDKNANIVIVCTKVDCLKDPEICNLLLSKNIQPLTTADLDALSTKYPSIPRVECSSKTGWNVKKVFETAVHSLVNKPSENTRCRCNIQ